MPRMLPSRPDADAPMSEQQVFESFREGLPDDWVVLHSRRFVLPGENGRRPHEGEIDFLVLDPARGLLALEVKGGAVQCQNGKWTSTENGRIHAIKDPGSQATAGIRALDLHRDSISFEGAGPRKVISHLFIDGDRAPSRDGSRRRPPTVLKTNARVGMTYFSPLQREDLAARDLDSITEKGANR